MEILGIVICIVSFWLTVIYIGVNKDFFTFKELSGEIIIGIVVFSISFWFPYHYHTIAYDKPWLVDSIEIVNKEEQLFKVRAKPQNKEWYYFNTKYVEVFTQKQYYKQDEISTDIVKNFTVIN
jgi:hypothetical protein